MVGLKEETRPIDIYHIEFMPEAARALSATRKPTQRLIKNAVDELAREPRPSTSKLLVKAENLRRLQVGDYRVIYGISESRETVTVELIRPRSKGYMFLAAFALTIRAKLYSK